MTAASDKQWVAMAVGAHPDDIEFMMAGTLLLLREAGAEIHMWNLSSGGLGSNVLKPKEIARIRAEEAANAAKIAGATLHPPIGEDLMIQPSPELTARAVSVIREVKPDILLIPSPQDYMEDHQNACRIALTAAFARGMPYFAALPPSEMWEGNVALYHGLPYGLRDGLRKRVRAGMYADITTAHATKRKMLAEHRSQKEWLDVSQGLDAYLETLDEMDKEVGRMSGRYEMAEGWRRHSHLGYCPEDWDPLSELLGDKIHIDQDYEDRLG